MSCPTCQPSSSNCTPFNPCPPENYGEMFPTLVGPPGPPGGPGTFVPSYELLRLIDATVWPDGYAAWVLGANVVSDGGDGIFTYNPTATDADNGATIIRPANGIGRWFRQFSGSISAGWFGASGAGGNDTAGLTAFFAFMATASPGSSFELAPNRTYRTTTIQVILGDSIRFNGNNSKILATAAMTAVLKLGAAALPTPQDIAIENVTLDANGLAAYSFWMTQGVNVAMRNVVTSAGTTSGFFFDGSAAGGTMALYSVTLYNCHASSPGFGFYFNKGGNTGAFESFTLINCTAEGGTHGIKSVGLFSLTGISGVYENHTTADIALDATRMTAIDVFTENGNGANDLIVTGGAIFEPYGTTNPVPISNTSSFVEQRVFGRMVVMNNNGNNPNGEILVGWLTDGLKNMTRLGHSRILNFIDTLFARNLTGMPDADTYTTLADDGYAGLEFRYGGAPGKKSIAFYTSSAAQPVGPFTPTIKAILDPDGKFGLGTSAPTQLLETVESASAVINQTRYATDADVNTFDNVIIGEWRAAIGAATSTWAYYPGIRAKGDAASSFGRRFKLILMTTNVGEVEALTLHPEGVAQLKNLTVAGLTAAASCQGALAYVTDASATTRLSTVAGGGANKVMVYSDGTNWLIL